MERPENDRTITIKINGQHRSYEESSDIKNNIDEIQELSNNGVIDREGINKDPDSLSLEQTAAAKEATDDDDIFEWILPEETVETDLKEYKIATKEKKENKKGIGQLGKSFKKNGQGRMLTSVFLTVFFAIILGTGFGLIMLKLVLSEHTVEVEQQPTVTEPIIEETKQPEAIESAVLQPLTAFVIQGGVFSNLEAAKQVQEDYIQKGISAKVIEINGQAVLYLGIASSIEEAKEIGKQFKEKGYDSFAKPITLDEKTIKGILPEEKKIIDAAPSIYAVLAEGVTEASLTSTISDKVVEKMKNGLNKVQSVDDKQLKNEGIISLKSELTKAQQQLLVFKESKDTASLAKAQQHLLEFISIYHTI
ncbi:SPOR domain-containing protein [Bacillus sp. S/N-304-OC-R1]|nr:SPOR domain-containing protein [Bacillus sp. S/N-304-OC-R1]